MELDRRSATDETARAQPVADDDVRILIVEDNPDNVIILRDRLTALGYTALEARDGEAALRAVGMLGPLPDDARLPDLILLDVMLPAMDGFEVARRIRAHRPLPFIPIIIQTALDTTEDIVVGLDAGADDYITKPINFAELEARMRSLLRMKSRHARVERQTVELSATNLELEQIARTDALTGIDNRRQLEEGLREAFDYSRRVNEPFACVMCDVDKFKEVNDTYGHPAGDAVLRQVAQLLRSEAREVDRVGRYGGEEFMLVLPGANGAAATAAAERVRKAVEGHTFSFAGAVIRRTMSCGVASWPHPGIADVAALVCAADEALYAAKAQGRNRVTRWAVRGIGAGESVVDTPGTKTPTAHTLYDPPTHDGEQRPGTGTGISHDARRSAT